MVSDQASRAGRKPPERFPMTSPGKAVEIRVATASDVEGILACLHSAFERYRREYTPSAYTATVLTTPMAKRRVRSMTVLVGVDSKGRIIGTVAVKRSSPGHAHLRGMAVLPQYQGKGVASALLDAAIRHAQATGQSYVTLETTEPLHRATRFYLRHGFRKTGRYRQWGGMKLIGFERAIPGPAKPRRPSGR